MKPFTIGLLVVSLSGAMALIVGLAGHRAKTEPPPAPTTMTAEMAAPPIYEVHFSPKGGCTEAIVKKIDAASSSIRVQAYSFTSQPIVDALVRAHARGVNVQVILDRSDFAGASPSTKEKNLAIAGVPVFDDAKHAIAHNKVMILDAKIVETGSFNFTAQAENANAENCLFITNAPLAALYDENWRSHLTHSSAAP